MIIRLPFPNPDLNPNRASGNHWAAQYKARKSAKEMGYYAAKEALQAAQLPKQATYALNITFVMPDKRRRDRDNLLASSKQLLDGIAQALGIDDNNFEPIVLRRQFDKGNAAMIVEIV